MNKKILCLLLSCLLIKLVGCGSESESLVKKEDYSIYHEYWYDKTIAESGPASIEVPEDTYDFDILPPNFESSQRFTLVNNGKNPLHLIVGPKSCKCTKLKIHDREIEPGGKGEIEVFWKTIPGAKAFKHTGAVYTNDPENKLVRFTIKGKVANALMVQPQGFNLDRIDPDSESTTSEIVVSSEEWDNLEVVDLASTFGDDAKLEVIPFTEEHQKKNKLAKVAKKIRLTLATPPRPKLINGMVTCKLKLPDRAPVDHEIQVFGKVIRRLSVEETDPGTLTTDSVVHFGRVNSVLGKKIRFLLTVNDKNKKLDLKTVKAEPEFVNAELNPLNKNVEKHGVYTLDLSIPADQEPINRNRTDSFGKLLIEFDHERIAPLELGLDFYIIK